MNLFDLQNNFWQMDEHLTFSGNDTRLYFYLLYLANRGYWQQDWIEYADEKMKAVLGVSPDVLRTSRSRLKDAGLIDFVRGGLGFRVKTRYRILTPKLNPNPNSIYNIKKKIKINTIKNENKKYSSREFIADGSDFD